MGIEDRVFEYISANGLICPGDRIGAAVSGGADSMVMLYLLKRLDAEIFALHFEHGIRPQSESERDMRFVESFCAENGISFICERARVPELKRQGESMETAARRLRYGFFEKTAEKYGLKAVATAHHADDNAETVLMNILRGSGPKGTEGITPRRGIYIRPMLVLTRAEIETFAAENGIDYVTDSTNFDTDYTRNKIRNLILPVFREINPSYADAFARLGELSREQNEAVSGIVDRELERLRVPCEQGLALDARELVGLPRGIAMQVIRAAISTVCPLKDIERSHFNAVYELAGEGRTGKCFALEGKFTALMSYNRLIIVGKLCKIKKNGEFRLELSGITPVFDDSVRAFAAKTPVFTDASDMTQFFDGEKLEGAVFRTRAEGDHICPLGVYGKKKLKDWLIDKKIPSFLRDGIPLLCRGSEVLWVVGFGISSSARVTKNTKHIIGLEYSPCKKI